MSNEFKYGKFELRPYQQEAFLAVRNHLKDIKRFFNDNNEQPLIGAYVTASVGAGKTAIMGAILSRFVEMGWPAICLARDLKLVQQNSETFWAMRLFNSIYSAKFSKKLDFANDGVIVSNEATAINAIESGAWDDYVPRAVVVDECHQVPVDDPNKVYMKILNELNRRCIEKHNHPIVLLGFTGSPYRHIMSILGDVWREELYDIDTATLVGMGYLVPTIYGAEVGKSDDLNYNLPDSIDFEENSTRDFTKSEKEEIEKEMIKDKPKLQKIVDEVCELTKERNAVMITCMGVKHCKEVAKLLPSDSWVIVHSGQADRTNDQALNKIKNREAKYLLQIGCLTTGYDEPLIDTSVILRPIGSLTLLVQLLGRGMRLLKDEHVDAGVTKENHLVLDYSGTMEVMGEMYENPILDECRAREDKAKNEPTLICPKCNHLNSKRANRCTGYDSQGHRCDHFFNYTVCADRKLPSGKIVSKGCGAKNDTRAKVCRCCNEWLFDPSENLNKEHYTDVEFVNVLGMTVGLTKDESKLLVQYHLSTGKKPRELFDLSASEKWRRATWVSFVDKHVSNSKAKRAMKGLKSPQKALEHKEFINAPVAITHRVNDKGYDIIARKKFYEED